MHQFRFLVVPAVLAIVLSFAAVVAQMDNGVIDPKPQTYKGYYYEGLEASNFYPCDYGEHWWIEPQVTYLSREYRRITSIQRVAADDIEPIYVELRGRLSELGKYGHMGLAHRKFDVDKVVVTNRVYQTDRQCKPAAKP